MTRENFNLKIKEYKIPDSWYSLNNGVKFNACILIDNHTYWESFYFDENGETHNLHLFTYQDEALNFLWGEIEDMIILYNWQPS